MNPHLSYHVLLLPASIAVVGVNICSRIRQLMTLHVPKSITIMSLSLPIESSKLIQKLITQPFLLQARV